MSEKNEEKKSNAVTDTVENVADAGLDVVDIASGLDIGEIVSSGADIVSGAGEVIGGIVGAIFS